MSCVRVALIQSRGTDTDVVNRFFIQYTGSAGTSAGLNTACTSIATAWNTNLAPWMGTQVTLTQVVAEDLSASTAPIGSALVSHTGSRTGTNLTAGQCVVVKNEISRRYRGGHPRTYLPAFTATDLTSANVWNTSSTSGLVTSWAAFITSAQSAINTYSSGAGAQMVNISYYNGFHNVTSPTTGRVRSIPTLRSPSPVIDVVTSFAANPNVCSQRRRNQAP